MIRLFTKGTARAARLCLVVFAILLPLDAALAVCTPSLSSNSYIQHDLTNSYCELCGIGQVHILVTNPRDSDDLSGIVVTENLGTSGLTYVPGSTVFVGTNVAAPASFEPVVSGTNGSILTWTFAPGFVLQGRPGGPGNKQGIEIRYQIRRATPGVNEEGLTLVNRTITAQVQFTPSCQVTIPYTDSDTGELPIRQPVPYVTKQGRNVDAGQGGYSDPVYGNENDDVIWRLRVENRGLANMQALILDDVMGTGNFNINYACPDETAALAVANNNGALPGGSPCIAVAPGNSLPNFSVNDPFGNPGNDEPGAYVDALAGSQADIFLVGKITNSCTGPRTNTVSNVQWGCQVDPPDGGITVPATTGGALPTYRVADSAVLSNVATISGLTVQQLVTGTNLSQPVGTKGTVRLIIRNQTGGTVKNIKLRDILPVQYVVDSTYTPTVSMAPAYGSYAGMTDNITWTNPTPGTFPLTSTNPADPLSNTAPTFTLTSTGCSVGPCGTADVHPNYPDQFNLMRHGDVLTVTFRIVLIRPQSYDLTANLDVREEMPTSTPPNTDPTPVTQLTNQVYTDFEELCTPGVIHNPSTNPLTSTTIPANPEDLDIDIVGSELIFILTNNPAQRLPLTVSLTNHGGHDAADFVTYVTFGQSMTVVTVPSGCTTTTNPPSQPLPWRLPVDLPATASVYRCTQASLAAGATRLYAFEVIKNAAAANDDLTFRADVIGEITLSNGTRLWFPTPTVRADGVLDRANNYSIDGIRARVIGFNLLKTEVGNCTENNTPPPALPDRFVQIGEECTFHVDTGGWFGFQTPGFTYIAVQDIQVVDQMPSGQGYLRSTNPLATSTSGIKGVTLNPAALAPLDQGWIDWRFNRVSPAERITVKDEWFRVDTSSRILNSPIDTVAAPNQHAALSTNVLNSYFQAVFYNPITSAEELYNLGPNTVGYPRALERTVDLTITEPRILVTKEVCNESLYGVGPTCTNFVPLASDGDARNTYVYRVTLTNEASSNSVTRAPAYDVTTTDILDPSDLAYVIPFNIDGLDNDGDGLIDALDLNGEGSINDNVVKNGTPATITISHTNSNALLRINPGQSVTLYYRVDFDDSAAPLQKFINNVSAKYDSLANASGNQTAPIRPNSDIGGARVYTSATATSTVEILPVLTQPKTVTRLSSTGLTGSSPQPVTLGEEVEYQLVTSLPVAQLRNFIVRDVLPAGIRCTEAPVVNLDAAPYSAAGFSPGGSFTPTCTNNQVEWNFGNQRVTQGTTNNRYDFAIRFIARVDNSAGNNNGGIIRNGGTSTSVTASYVDQAGASVVLTFGEAAILVREPVIALTKAFAVTNADASDVLTVTVTATNTGTATAYNLRVLDDLAAVAHLTYLGNVSGTDPPDVVDTTTLGANRPIFIWSPSNPKFAIAPGATRSFTFKVLVDPAVQPLEILDNTVQARWTSLRSQNIALNSTGLIGVDGSLTGMRIGALPNAGDPINHYETTATASATVPAIGLTKTDLSPAVIPAIGAHKNFQIEIRLPEGQSKNLIVTDNLAATGISYVLENNAGFDVTYTFDGITSINGAPPSEAAFIAFPADNSSGSVVWNIGNVVTASENDTVTNAVNPVIRINYYARVNNDLVTNAGLALQNVVTLNYAHGETGVQQTVTASAPAVTVVEPLLVLAKTVTNVTAPGQPPVAGDILEYRVTATNTGTSTAFDTQFIDTLPAGTQWYASFTPTAVIGVTPVAGFVATPAGAPAGPLTWGRGNGDGSLDVPVGQTLTLTYRTLVQVVIDPAGLIGNSVIADWTSLNDVNSLERTGAGCPTITQPNDYCAGPVSATTTGTRPVVVFVKTVINVTTGQNPGINAAPGNTLRYHLEIRNLGGAITNFSVVDELDQLNATAKFLPGSLTLVSALPPGAVNLTNATGGAKGSGLIDIRNLSVGAVGSANANLVIEFQVQLVPVIINNTVALNQAQLLIAGLVLQKSDDPNIVGTQDPTSTLISSAPLFRVLKTSQDLTGDPSILLPGETLRYTITVKNIGTENATGVTLRDLIPANTTYVANSTRLNGSPLADPTAGVSPLQTDILIHAPEDSTPGALRADATVTTTNVATIVFDVVINTNVVNGTIISNQGFVNGTGTSGVAVPEKPSDDPATPAVDDPTRNVVGDLPLIYALKTVKIQVDNGTPGIVDPGDVLRYTFLITNTGAVPATAATLTDALPNDTTYVANSLRLNGLPVAGAFPLAAGLPISSSDRTPPLPAAGAGILSRGGTATVIFDAQVNAATPTGTIISNQGRVGSNELPPQLTDADGSPANGYQPTQIVVGNAQRLTITKKVAVVGGGAALVGSQLEYVVQVTNIGAVPATRVVITDPLAFSPATPPRFVISYVAGSARMNSATTGVTLAGSTITADYATAYGNLAPGGTVELRFRVQIDAGVLGATIANTAQVTWDTPTLTASASASIDIGGAAGSAALNGRVWHDANFNNIFDSTELPLAGWQVQVYANGLRVASVLTDTNGVYQILGLAPYSSTNIPYELRFRAPGAGASTASLGLADHDATLFPLLVNGPQRISNIEAGSGSNIQNLNLPIDPDGVVYNSVLRTPTAGATLTLLRTSTLASVPASCFDDAAQQNQVTLAQGYYKFDLNFSDPACPSGADYLIRVTPPVSGYGAAVSAIIPPTASSSTPAYSVPSCPADAITTPAGYCEAQASEFAPSTAVPPQTAGTTYYLNLTLDNGTIPGHSQLFDNHIPLDPNLGGAVAISKTSPLINVTRGQLVPYTITVKNTLGATLPFLSIVDTFPPGFKYVVGSAQFDGVASEPAKTTRQFSWDNLTLTSSTQHTIKLLLIVGAGVADAEYVNRAQVINTATGGAASALATATVRVTPDPTFDCTDIIGKVFDDVNANGYQDRGEAGLAGVRVVSARGLIATTDKYGRYHITCAVVPNEDRGSNFILKLDDHSLPSGYRVTTENPLVLRATRGKMMKFNFGATLHRVVRLDISDAVFEPGTTDMRPQWRPRTGILVGELRKAPSILRISYLADVEDAGLVTRRLQSVKRDLIEKWKEENHPYELTVETEIYWRRGGPPDHKVLSK